MSQPKTILNIIKVIHDKLEITPRQDKILSISLWDFIDENRDTIPKMDLKSGLRKLTEDGGIFQLKDIRCLDRPGRFAGEKIELEINRKQFKKFYEGTARKEHSSDGIYYDKYTGVGYAYGRRFKFKNDQPEFLIFAEMYDDINRPLARARVLQLANYEKSEDETFEKLSDNPKRKSSSHTSATYFINELAKKMRGMTGLSIDQLVNNNGDLTLVSNKLQNPPK